MIDRIRSRALALPRRWKQAVLVIVDFVALAAALWCSYCLRYDTWYAPWEMEQWAIVLSAPVVAIPIFIRLGLYRAVIRYLPDRAIWTIMRAMALAAVCWVVLAFLLAMAGQGMVPRSVPLIYFGLGTLVVIAIRFAAKWMLQSTSQADAEHNAVLIYGAGEAGIQLAHSLRSTHAVVGFLDDNPALQKRELAGVRVYSPQSLKELVTAYGVRDIILSMPTISPQRRKEIVALVSEPGLRILSLPSLVDLVTGKYLVSQIKEIDIIELLGRSSVPPDPALIRDMVVGRSVMVTGAGGSIGSELCRKIAQWKPQRLVLFEANEFALYQIDRELSEIPGIVVVPVLGSVANKVRIENAIAGNDVKVIFHAAAHKHVPLVEANVFEGITNNVFGTKVVADVAFDLGVEHFVLISTDKAVRPTNVMGATKRWAELIIGQKAAASKDNQLDQRFCAVRFGNVLGSNGSVVPLFKQQIAQGGPITLTDAAMTRYFMSIQEAAELIVQAGALSGGGDVFLLDMGEPMLISDLAKSMVRLAGLTIRNEHSPHGDIEIVVTGKRPGEKLYEELFYDSSSAQMTEHAKIMRAAGHKLTLDLDARLAELLEAVEAQDEPRTRHVLFKLVSDSG
jgi:FlaA1/EpsC-like NDP-sugar epimerase